MAESNTQNIIGFWPLCDDYSGLRPQRPELVVEQLTLVFPHVAVVEEAMVLVAWLENQKIREVSHT